MSAADRQKWDAKYTAAETAPSEPSAVLLSLADYLPTRGRALDIAGGAGRNALWLAHRALDVTIADISPIGLALARHRAAEQALTLNTLEIDLEQQPFDLPPFDLILSVCYLWRPLFAEFPRLLNAGGCSSSSSPRSETWSATASRPLLTCSTKANFRGLPPVWRLFITRKAGWPTAGTTRCLSQKPPNCGV